MFSLWLVEALAAMLILVGIVWWTMFSGRPKGEPPRDDDKASDASGHDKSGP